MKKMLLLAVALMTGLVLYSQDSLQKIIESKGINRSELLVVIDKSDRLLSVYHKDTILISYPCVLGFNPVDDKKQEGDGCTPEGTFRIRSMYAHKSWKYFIWIDYPNAESWEKFRERKSNGEIDQNADIGGEIGIHGVPEGLDEMIDEQVDWTLGCISLRNSDIEDLFNSIRGNTMIVIRH